MANATRQTVERYIAKKLARKELGARSINMTLVLGAAIVESAMERYPDELPRNPFKGRRRRVKEHRPKRSYLDSADSIQALLDAAGAMDSEARDKHVHRTAILGTLVFAGLRISELCDLRWRGVDLAGGWLHVEGSKTDAADRRVKIRGALRDILLEIKPRDADTDGYVFATRQRKADAGRMNPSNVRNGILGPAEKRASASLVKRGLTPLPHLTPHSCRRTFASVLYALGEPATVIKKEMGHKDAALALNVYADVMDRDEQENARLRILVEGTVMAAQTASNGSGNGSRDDLGPAEILPEPAEQGQKNGGLAGSS